VEIAGALGLEEEEDMDPTGASRTVPKGKGWEGKLLLLLLSLSRLKEEGGMLFNAAELLGVNKGVPLALVEGEGTGTTVELIGGRRMLAA